MTNILERMIRSRDSLRTESDAVAYVSIARLSHVTFTYTRTHACKQIVILF